MYIGLIINFLLNEDAYGCGDDVMDNIEETVAADKDNVMGDVEMRKNVGNTRVEGGSSNRKGDNVVEHETIINQEGTYVCIKNIV